MKTFVAAARPAVLPLALAAAFPLLSTASIAQPLANELDAVVVTATRAPQPLAAVAADVTVIGREEIERRAAGSVVELLRATPGFQFSRNGGAGANTELYLRGGETRFTAVLVDGVRIDTQSGSGGANWQNLPLAMIERIEIVRGPASAVYGSDAVGGVVQIFTRRSAEGLAAEAGFGVGSQRSAQLDASLRGGGGMWDYALSAARERSDGFNARTNTPSGSGANDRDGHDRRSLQGRLGLQLGPTQRLELSALGQRLDAGYDRSAASPDDDRALRELDTLQARWTAQWTPAWRSQLSAARSTDFHETRPSFYLTETQVRSFAWQNDLRLGAHSLQATLERREDALDNRASAAAAPLQAGRHQDALALGYGWRTASGSSLQLNLRHDDDSEFGAHRTGSVAAGWMLTPALRLHASAGTAFRAPTLYQRFSPYGNAALQPERSHHQEIGLSHRDGARELGLTLYRTRVSQLIQYTSQPGVCADPSNCYRNVGRALLQGATLQGAQQLGALRLSGSLDWLSPENRDTGLQLQRRARRSATLHAGTELGGWTLGAELFGTGERYNNATNTERLAGYGLLNLDAQYRVNPEWRLLLRLDNALDRHHETARTYAGAPRSGFVGLRWTPAH